jgi:tryptophanase
MWCPITRTFDTTRANVEYRGATALDIPNADAHNPEVVKPFKGDMDVDALRRVLEENPLQVPIVMLTVTNNSGGGQPVSMANIRAVSEICHGYRCPVLPRRLPDRRRMPGSSSSGKKDMLSGRPLSIAQEMFSYVDGCTMSAKKDGLANIGGYLALNDDALARRCKNMLILTEGFPTYGGLAGYDLEAIAVGLLEALDEDYLRYRIRSVAYLGDILTKAGIPIVQPPGGHAIYLDARRILDHLPPLQYPGWALANALYIAGGVRSVEIGTVMFGHHPDGRDTGTDGAGPAGIPAPHLHAEPC